MPYPTWTSSRTGVASPDTVPLTGSNGRDMTRLLSTYSRWPFANAAFELARTTRWLSPPSIDANTIASVASAAVRFVLAKYRK
jgi:hypothetical protein